MWLGVFVVKKTKQKFFVTWCLRGKGFTLVELIVAIGLLVMVVAFSSVIFKAGIGSYRTAMAQTEIMQKLRVITEQLNADFKGLQKDGYLIIYDVNLSGCAEYPSADPNFVRSDKVYFFAIGDFQSWWVNPTVKSNIARIYIGHGTWLPGNSNLANTYVNHWRLARDTQLLCPGTSPPPGADFNNISFALCKADTTFISQDTPILIYPPDVNITHDPNTARRLFCEGLGQFKIEWTDGFIDPSGSIAWFGLEITRRVGFPPDIPGDPCYTSIDPNSCIERFSPGFYYMATWRPSTASYLWPKAIKFTFTIYDSKGIFKDGQTFTHIVYIGD